MPSLLLGLRFFVFLFYGEDGRMTCEGDFYMRP